MELGVDIVLHSATKFLGGHSDVLAGLAVTRDEDLGNRLKQLQNGLGRCSAPQDSWLLMRGMKTLQARMEQAKAALVSLPDGCCRHPACQRVYYPGLEIIPAGKFMRSSHLGMERSFPLMWAAATSEGAA